MSPTQPDLPWLAPGDAFPDVESAWGAQSPASGLLAGGADLRVQTLLAAYSQGIFPWFSAGQPILWWSPDPRMVLRPQQFKVHRSLRRTLQNFARNPDCEIRIDSAFAQVIAACANAPRQGQSGTWIVPAMQQAYTALHRAGFAHSVECWVQGELVGGLYCVNLGQMVFGESMFARATDASKIALSALVALCRAHDIRMIDCQQNTQHLAFLGASEISRRSLALHIAASRDLPPPPWKFENLYWTQLLGPTAPSAPHLAPPLDSAQQPAA